MLNKNKITITAFLIFFCFSLSGKDRGKESDTLFHHTLTKWFSAWELVYKDIYGIENIQPVDFLLFDNQHVYSTSDISIKNGNMVAEIDLLNLHLKWKKTAHNGTLILPDGSSIPVGMMCFASANTEKIPFFVMPLPTFWSNLGIESKELGLENLITGVFLHEFSHTQQMQNFGRKITEYEKQALAGDHFDDNFIQNTFQSDSGFAHLYHREVSYFYDAIADEEDLYLAKLQEGLRLMEKRRKEFYIASYTNLEEIEDLFLTMEGLGQYTMYVWLTHEKGGNLTKETAIKGVRRNKRLWSQDEGFALFLILEKYTPPREWAREMFRNNLVNVTDLIKEQLD